MTRDEAEIAAIKAVGWEFSEDARRHLAILAAVGLLKFDEPNDEMKGRAVTVLRSRVSDLMAVECVKTLYSYGLKIVEK